jgi:hypothetical protein
VVVVLTHLMSSGVIMVSQARESAAGGCLLWLIGECSLLREPRMGALGFWALGDVGRKHWAHWEPLSGRNKRPSWGDHPPQSAIGMHSN